MRHKSGYNSRRLKKAWLDTLLAGDMCKPLPVPSRFSVSAWKRTSSKVTKTLVVTEISIAGKHMRRMRFSMTEHCAEHQA